MQECHRASKEYRSQSRPMSDQRQDLFSSLGAQDPTRPSDRADAGPVTFLLGFGSDIDKCSSYADPMTERPVIDLLICDTAPHK